MREKNGGFPDMNRMLLKSLILFLFFFGFPSLLPAKTGYVTDMLFLTLRESPQMNSNVLQRLKSDTPVIILEEQGDYYKVALESKETGWVDKRFISFETPKSTIIETLKSEKKALEEKLLGLQNQSQSSRNTGSGGDTDAAKKIQDLEAALTSAKNESAGIRQKYDALVEQSGNIQKLINDNKQLQEKNSQLSAEIENISANGSGFFKTSMIKWALAGVAVLLLGWLFGSSASINRQKGSSLFR